ncbi:MAG: lipoate--protein ligase family protein [Planctomycetes bacterium]|nr:lipoate--protein ligase family protein [Planctomycetota bacterium]
MWRLIEDGPGHPAWNMAVDAALLEVGEGAVLRFYSWFPPGLSIGYFQEPPRDVPDGCVLVRRPTGGGAILHDDELTYSMSGVAHARSGVAHARPGCGPASLSFFARGQRETYAAANRIVVAALAALGVNASQRGTGNSELGTENSKGASVPHSAFRTPHSSGALPFLCFERRSPFDVVASGEKIAGSAQRRGRERCLIHGSIRLAAAGRRLDPDDLTRAFQAALERETCGLVRPGALSARERAAAERLLPDYESFRAPLHPSREDRIIRLGLRE